MSPSKPLLTENDCQRRGRLEAYVSQALLGFRQDANHTRSSAALTSLPSYSVIQEFLAYLGPGSPSRDKPKHVDVAAFRKCLFAIGCSADDTSFLLRRLDLRATGSIDGKLFTRLFMSPNANSPTSAAMMRAKQQSSAQLRASTMASGATGGGDDRAAKELHRRMVEKVLLRSKNQNIKDAFRQYDLDRTGYLTHTQFRSMLRDHGFVGADVDVLIKHLDRSNQQSISFHAFVGDVKLGAGQSYPKPSPKKTTQPLAKPFGAKSNAAASMSYGDKPMRANPEPTANSGTDPMETIRAKLRQRVMGHNKSIREVFLEYDMDGNGHLDHDEFKAFMAKYRFTEDEANMVIDFLDQDYSGTIDYDEFAAGLLFYRPPPAVVLPSPAQHQPLPSNTRATAADGQQVLRTVRKKLDEKLRSKAWRIDLRAEYAKYDSDDKDGLDHQEFGAFLIGIGVKLKADELAALLSTLNTDGSERIEFEEFASLVSPEFLKRSAQVKGEDGGFYPNQSPPMRQPTDKLQRESDNELWTVFNRYDIHGSGHLDYGELSQLMRDHGFSESDIVQVIKQIDRDGAVGNHKQPRQDGVDYDLFSSVMSNKIWKQGQVANSPKKLIPSRGNAMSAELKEACSQWVKRALRDNRSLNDAFKHHDNDASGELDHEEFRRFMKHYGMKRDGDINAILDLLDSNGNGTISYEEFSRVFGRVKSGINDNKKPLADQRNQSNEANRARQQQRAEKSPSKEHWGEDTKRQLVVLREQELLWLERALRDYASVESAFRDFDRKNRGELDYEQFRDFMGQYGITDETNVSLLLKRLDVDNSGTVDKQEFLSVFDPDRLSQHKLTDSRDMYQPSRSPTKKRQESTRLRDLELQWIRSALAKHRTVKDAFMQSDRDGNGELDQEEFCQLMAAFGIREKEHIDVLLKRLDADESGTIEYEEFSTVFHESRVGDQEPAKRQSTQKQNKLRQQPESKKDRAARLRNLEIKWIKRALGCHESIEAAFHEYDVDDSGELDHEEFSHIMKRYGIVRDDDIDLLIRRLDANESGTIDFEEFSTIFNPLRADQGPRAGLFPTFETLEDDAMDPEELESILEVERELANRMMRNTRDMRVAFQKFDMNGNGRIEYAEFRKVLKSYKFPELEIRKVIRHLDRDVSGFIDYKEFVSGFSVSKDSGSTSPTDGVRRKSKYTVTRVSPKRPNGTMDRGNRGSSSVEAVKKQLLSKILSTHGTVQSVFRTYDVQKQGRLTAEQFEGLMQDHDFSLSDAQLLMDALDRDKSGTIEYEEFLSQLVVRTNV